MFTRETAFIFLIEQISSDSYLEKHLLVVMPFGELRAYLHLQLKTFCTKNLK